MQNPTYISFLLRLGLAFSFAYAGVGGLREPSSWIGFLPLWVGRIAPPETILFGFSLFELALAIWLVSGVQSFWASIVSAATLAKITIFNLGILDITFRDIGLFFAAIALSLLVRRKGS